MRLEPDLSKIQVIKPSVSAFIADGEGRVLLGRRADSGEWGLPGGSVEIGETVTEAIVREVREETGLEVEAGRLIGVYSDPKWQAVLYPDGRAVHYVTTFLECRVKGGRLRISAETLELRHVHPEHLPPDTVPQHIIRIRDAIRRLPSAVVR